METLTPIKRQTLSDNLAVQLKKFIIAQNYQCGARLPTVSELAVRFNVGQPTIREAIKKLETAGVVKVKHGSGMFVGDLVHHLFLPNPILSNEPPTKKVLTDLIEAKIPIEVQAITQAVNNINESGIRKLQLILDKAQKKFADDDALHELNVAFHKEIALSSGNYLIYQIIDVFSILYQQEQRFLIDRYLSKKEDLEDHFKMFEAIKARDKKKAVALMHQHLEKFRESIENWDPSKYNLEVNHATFK